MTGQDRRLKKGALRHPLTRRRAKGVIKVTTRKEPLEKNRKKGTRRRPIKVGCGGNVRPPCAVAAVCGVERAVVCFFLSLSFSTAFHLLIHSSSHSRIHASLSSPPLSPPPLLILITPWQRSLPHSHCCPQAQYGSRNRISAMGAQTPRAANNNDPRRLYPEIAPKTAPTQRRWRRCIRN